MFALEHNLRRLHLRAEEVYSVLLAVEIDDKIDQTVCSVSCSAPAAVTEIQPVSGTRILGIYSGILGQCERHEIGAKLAALLIVP
jgi:hypothetical protein